MKKRYTRIVENCKNCPEVYWSPEIRGGSWKDKEGAKLWEEHLECCHDNVFDCDTGIGKMVDVKDSIPDWCPLEDWEIVK